MQEKADRSPGRRWARRQAGKASRVGKNAGFPVVGGVVAHTGALALLAGIVLILGLLAPHWLSAPIVGLVISAVGAFLVVNGANTLRREDPAPRETVETPKEDREWLKNQTSR